MESQVEVLYTVPILSGYYLLFLFFGGTQTCFQHSHMHMLIYKVLCSADVLVSSVHGQLGIVFLQSAGMPWFLETTPFFQLKPLRHSWLA